MLITPKLISRIFLFEIFFIFFRGHALFLICGFILYLQTLCTKPCTTVIEAYEAVGTLEGYCVCDGRGTVAFEACDNGTIYNPGRGVCVPTANVSIVLY